MPGGLEMKKARTGRALMMVVWIRCYMVSPPCGQRKTRRDCSGRVLLMCCQFVLGNAGVLLM